ncbi:protease [Hydrogenobacter sp. Uz 6-8]|uniref:protease n=1 Tax=Hydrogenobacter sp. Uz 6-8 TaxID=3384828 RepID=UPI0038FC875D
MSINLALSQTIVVPIPGQPREQTPQPIQTPQSSSGGGAGLGLVVGSVVGGLILSLIFSKAVPAKPAEGKGGKDQKMPAFVPFEFIVVHRGLLEGLEVIERGIFEDINFSLVRWEKSQRELEESLKDSVLFVQPNFIYELFGEATAQVRSGEGREGGLKAGVCLLDTGADQKAVGGFLLRVENHLRSPYAPEDHGTASAYLIGSGGAGVYLHRVCSEGRCTSFAFAKALVECFREGVRVINTPFGMYGEDRLAGLIISGISRAGFRVVAPVGNEPSRVLPFPARHPAVVKVAGDPCFPRGLCENFPREPYRVKALGVGGMERLFVGTSFSSALHAVRLALEPSEDKQ